LNVESTRTLTAEALKRNAFLVYISTDYVFPGRVGEAPYRVTDKPDPPNIYGRTKWEGEQAVLSVSASEPSKGKAVILRVPLLYGHVDEDDKSKSAVHPLVDAVWKAQKIKDGEPKIPIDSWGLRFPTCTEDVARVLVDISKKYKAEVGNEKLPQILQFSGQKQYTKWEMVQVFAEILGLPIDNLEAYDPSKEPQAEGATQRPYDSHLEIAGLKELGVEVSNQDFVAWW
jgi:S-adenosylmethionine synthetase